MSCVRARASASGSRRRARRHVALAAVSASVAALLSACELGAPPAFPARERFGLEAPELPSAYEVTRLEAEGARAFPARFDGRGACAAVPGFAPPPWTLAELELVLAAVLGRPLAQRGATLSYDPRRQERLCATDASGRVLVLELDAQGRVERLELAAGFGAEIAGTWRVERGAQHFALVDGAGARLEFALGRPSRLSASS